jgi:hypothetical protein
MLWRSFGKSQPIVLLTTAAPKYHSSTTRIWMSVRKAGTGDHGLERKLSTEPFVRMTCLDDGTTQERGLKGAIWRKKGCAGADVALRARKDGSFFIQASGRAARSYTSRGGGHGFIDRAAWSRGYGHGRGATPPSPKQAR